MNVRDALAHLFGSIRADSANGYWGGWYNDTSGLGTSGDKSTGWRFSRVPDWSVEDLSNIYEADSIAKRCVAAPVEDALRQGFRIVSNGDHKTGEEWIKRANRKYEFEKKFRQILIESRLYGGVALVFAGPSIQWAEPDFALPVEIGDDISQPDFGKPQLWRITLASGMQTIIAGMPADKVLPVFGGTTTQRALIRKSQYIFWPPSVLKSVLTPLRLYRSAMAGLGALLQDFGVGIYSVNNLNDVMASADGAENLKTWMRARDLLKSAVNAIVLDAGGPNHNPETYQRTATPMAEVAALVDRFHALLSEATGIPITRLFGQAPSGLSTDDLSGTRSYYDMVQSYREKDVQPVLERLIAALSQDPEIGPVAGEIEWPSLWQYSPSEEAEIRLKTAQADSIYLDHGATTPEAVAKTRGQSDGWRQDLPPDTEPMPILAPPEVAYGPPQPAPAAPNSGSPASSQAPQRPE